MPSVPRPAFFRHLLLRLRSLRYLGYLGLAFFVDRHLTSLEERKRQATGFGPVSDGYDLGEVPTNTNLEDVAPPLTPDTPPVLPGHSNLHPATDLSLVPPTITIRKPPGYDGRLSRDIDVRKGGHLW